MNDLPNLVGHTAPQQTLLRLANSGQMPHAWLFHGVNGIGKRLLAEYWGRYILCGPQSDTADAVTFNKSSPLFAQIEAGSSPDFIVIEPEDGKKSIGVAQVREKMQQLALASDYNRVVIVDAAEDMTTSAANALLKILEEPAPGIYFVLISHNLSRLLPTIISRCRLLRFGPLTDDETRQVIRAGLPEVDFERLEQLVDFAHGSPGHALGLAGQAEEAMAAVEKVLEKTPSSASELTQLTETLQRKGVALLAYDILLQKLAQRMREAVKQGENTLTLCEIYAKLQNEYLKTQEFNLSPQLALECALKDVIGLNSLNT